MANMTKHFAVTNNTKRSIHVKLNLDGIHEVTASPSQQVSHSLLLARACDSVRV